MKTELRIDPDFEHIEPPLSAQAFEALEGRILEGETCPPIYAWKGTVLSSHHQYAIFVKHNMTFAVERIEAKDRLAAFVWACKQHLRNPEITDETSRYLIGKHYLAENQRKREHHQLLRNKKLKTLEMRNSKGTEITRFYSRFDELNKSYGISYVTAKRYARYAKAIDSLRAHNQELVSLLLRGSIKLSIQKTMEMTQMSPKTIQRVFNDLRNLPPYASLKYFRQLTKPQDCPQKSIKDMPDFDPDAEVLSLALTLPSWKEMLQRAIRSLEANPVSFDAKKKLQDQIQSLIQPIADILQLIVRSEK